MFRRILTGFAAVALSSQAVAQEICFTPDEIETVVLAGQGDIVRILADGCADHLSANTPLIARGEAIATRYAAAAQAVETEAGNIMSRRLSPMMSSEDDDPFGEASSADNSEYLELIPLALFVLVDDAERPRVCQVANNIIGAIEPLSPQQSAQLIASLADIYIRTLAATESDEDSMGPSLSICGTGAR